MMTMTTGRLFLQRSAGVLLRERRVKGGGGKESILCSVPLYLLFLCRVYLRVDGPCVGFFALLLRYCRDSLGSLSRFSDQLFIEFDVFLFDYLLVMDIHP